MKQSTSTRVAIATSILLHAVFIFTATQYWIPGAEILKQETRKLFDIKGTNVHIDSPKLTRSDAAKGYVEKLKFKQPESAPAMNQQMLSTAPSNRKVDAPDVREKIEDIKKNLPIVEQAILKTKMKESKKTIDSVGASEMNIFEALDVNKSTLSASIEVPETFKESMYGFSPSYRSPDQGAGKFGTDKATGSKSALGIDGAGQRSVDDFMTTSVQTYVDPVDGQGYYRLSLAPGHGAGVLEVLQKEVIFLVDASLSIRDWRLENFVKGIKYAVHNLNPGDKFNIYTFKDHITQLSSNPLASTDETIRNAMIFLNRLQPSEQTDIYEAFLESIKNKASMKPSYIVFLSDGNPTQGLTSSAKLIGKISKINRRERSIFSFSGGKKVNRYLLDFLSYQNRGWSEYAAENKDIDERISDLYDKIRNPLLMNVRFQINGLEEKEVYPKHLPDFYLNTEFIVYGKYRKEDKFTMRVIGQGKEETKELVFSQQLSDADPGTQDIKMFWAFNKYYHLISRITLEGESPELVNELKAVGKKYGIKSPYYI